MNFKRMIAGVAGFAGSMAGALALDTDNLANTGTEVGSFLENITPGVQAIIFGLGIAGAIVGLIVAIIFAVKKVATAF